MSNATITAQVLYDLRETYGFCDGNDLHDFFAAATGHTSPSGYALVSAAAAAELLDRSCERMAHNSPSLQQHCLELLYEADDYGLPVEYRFRARNTKPSAATTE
jgi:hypothetical protein